MQPNSRQYFWDILLYSRLGCFSYFFLVRFADIPLRYQDRLLTPEAFVAVMLLFNGVGLGMRYIQLRLRRSYPTFLGSRRQMVLFFVLSGAFLFLLNYLLLVSVKLLLDMPHPFQLVYKGTRLLLITWLTELVIVSQSVSNRFYKDLLAAYRRTRQLEETALQARYMALQTQLNPHFLFNSLNTLWPRLNTIRREPSALRATFPMSTVTSWPVRTSGWWACARRWNLSISTWSFIGCVWAIV